MTSSSFVAGSRYWPAAQDSPLPACEGLPPPACSLAGDFARPAAGSRRYREEQQRFPISNSIVPIPESSHGLCSCTITPNCCLLQEQRLHDRPGALVSNTSTGSKEKVKAYGRKTNKTCHLGDAILLLPASRIGGRKGNLVGNLKIGGDRAFVIVEETSGLLIWLISHG